MDFLTLDLIKTHCRIECYSEDPDEQRRIDETIKECANLAEGIVYEHIGKDYSAIMKEYGEIPIKITQAALMATADMILKRNPKENYAFKMILKPYSAKDIKRIDRFEYDGENFHVVIEGGELTFTDKETGETIKRK